MNKSQVKESVKSPSITPPSYSTKPHTNAKKRPPVHKKHKPNDITNQIKNSSLPKPPTPKKKSNKSRTNSITPKTLKSALHDKIFHNSNLSDTDVSAKYLESRPHSKINKSLINRLELTQKVKDLKKNSPFIDQIIKKSLNKAKQRKLSQEKENKELELEKEIRKQELLIHNHQIRVQNSLKCKNKKKHRAKSRWDHTKIRSESSSKVRNYTGSLLLDADTRNKRSVSIGDYYPQAQRKSDPYILEYIDYKNHKRKENDGFEEMKKKAEELSKANRLKNLENFTRMQHQHSPKSSSIEISSNSEEEEKNDEEIYVKRNISFIEDRNSENSMDKEPFESSRKRFHSENFEEVSNGRNHLIGRYSEGDNSQDIRERSACLIQRFFRGYLIKQYLLTKRNVEMQSFEGTNIVKKRILEIQKGETVTLKTHPKKKLQMAGLSKIEVKPLAKALLEVTCATSETFVSVKPKKSLALSPETKMTIPCKHKSKDLKKQLQEQISWNNAQIFIIEQLRSFEIASFSNYFSHIPQTFHEEILNSINQKYKGLLKTLKESVETSHLDVLESLSLEEYKAFEESSQVKQETLHKILSADLRKKELALNLQVIPIEFNEVGVQQSSDMSSEEGEVRLGITHSKSLSQLHGELPQGKYIGPSQSKEPSKFPVFFDIEDSIEVQSINLITHELEEGPNKKNLPSLPSLPMLHLDLMQQDIVYSEPRILTSTEFILDYIRNVFSCLDLHTIIKNISTPIQRNTMEEMVRLQEKDFGTPTELKIYDFPKLFDVEKLLEIESDENELETTMRQINKADKIHKKMILEMLNFLLQQFRPYGYSAEPLPWSVRPRVIRNEIKCKEMIEKVCKDFELLSMFQAGRIFNEEIITSNGGIDDDLISRLREERLERLLAFEVIEEEPEWLDFEYEETQTKLDVSDMVLEVLAEELINLINL